MTLAPNRLRHSYLDLRRLGRQFAFSFGAMALLTAGTQAKAAPLAVASVIWQGTLSVHEQKGPTCVTDNDSPLRVPIWGNWQDGHWWLWGAMEPMRVRAVPTHPTGQAALQPWTGEDSAGQIEWASPPQPGSQAAHAQMATPRLFGMWQEQTSPKGCAYTKATLDLSPMPEAAQNVAKTETPASGEATTPSFNSLLEHRNLLAESLQRLARLKETYSAEPAEPLLQRLALLAQLAMNNPTARKDRTLALTWLQAGERASELRQHTHALSLIRSALAVYEPDASENRQTLQDAALALASLARAQSRARQLEQAHRTITQGLTLLEQHSGADTGAASSLHNQLGALWLRRQHPENALRSFAQAVSVDEIRNAQPTETVASLMNSGATLEELGQPQAALKLYERCVTLLSNAATSPDAQTLTELVRARIQALASVNGITAI